MIKLPNRKSGKAAKAHRALLFKKFRDHQRKVAADGGGSLTRFLDSGRTEWTYASAPYGEHAVSAFRSAISQQHFYDRMREYARR